MASTERLLILLVIWVAIGWYQGDFATKTPGVVAI
jgi:hypothetical protein